VQKRINIVEDYFAAKLLVQTPRQFLGNYPGRNVLTTLVIKCLLDKFREVRSIQDSEGHNGRTRSVKMENCIVTEKMFGAFSKEIHKTCSGREILQGVSYVHNVPGSSPVSMRYKV